MSFSSERSPAVIRHRKFKGQNHIWLVVSTNPSEKYSSSVGLIIPFPILMESHNPFSKFQNWKNDGWIFTNSSLSSGPLDIRVTVWKMIPPAISQVILPKKNGLKSGWWWEKPQKNLRICERYLELSSQVIRKRKYRMVIET